MENYLVSMGFTAHEEHMPLVTMEFYRMPSPLPLTRRQFLQALLGLSLAACTPAASPDITTSTPSHTLSAPSVTPSLSATPLPSDTPAPSATPAPTATPVPTTLRDFADLHGVKIYALVLYYVFEDPAYRQMALQTANGLIPGNNTSASWIFENVDWSRVLEKWPEYEEQLDAGVIPDDASYNWKSADQRLAFARENRMDVMALHLLYAAHLTDGMLAACQSKEDFAKIVKFTVKARALHFKGQVKLWSGVNEIVRLRLFSSDDPYERFVQRMVDDELIHNVFVWLKEADPQAQALLSDSWVVEAPAAPNYKQVHDQYFALLDKLLERGTPLDGSGMHNHFWAYDPPDPEFVLRVIEQHRQRGLACHATETTVSLNPTFQLQPRRQKRVQIDDPLQAQAQIYRNMLEVFASTGNLFGMFGLTDRDSWYADIDQETGYTGPGAYLFDRDLQPKPAYFAMLDYLKMLNP